MKQICISCDGSLKNTGRSAKDKAFGYTRGILRFPTVANDGTLNYLDLTAPDMNAEILGKLNNPDPSKRFYFISDLENVVSEQADATYDTSDTNQRDKTLEGVKNMQYDIKKASHEYLGQVDALCTDTSDIRVDNCGNLLGITDSAEEKLYGRDIHTGSYDAKYMDATTTTVPMVHVDYDYEITTSDAQLTMLAHETFTELNVLNLKSMLDVVIKVDSVDSATELTVSMHLIYGTAGNRIPVSGVSIADMDLLDDTGASVGPFVGVTETATPGTYTLTTPATTTGEDYKITLFKAATAERVNGLEGFPVTYTSQ